jgi:L-seryl-tRNA(Ser) seleniumtransferase
METIMQDLRSLPSVDQMLQSAEVKQWISVYGRPLTVDALRHSIEEARISFSQGRALDEKEIIYKRALKLLNLWTSPSLIPVINATGVILHTNLGRAPLSKSAVHAVQLAAAGYSNLEYDLEKGKRGSRLIHAVEMIKMLTGAEDALIVNNNASAVLLVLTGLAKRKKVVIARSQLVEIGGGFRIPDVMKQSGAKLLEVGTTNRVHLRDYEQALEDEGAALVMRAHRSNFRITGFTSEPELWEIANIAHGAGIPLVDDLGSGALIDTAKYGLEHEPTIQESLHPNSGDGADLVCFSGDKLLGGPQAGLVVGRTSLVSRLRAHPLARAIRADKLCLAGLSATLLHYIKDEAEQEIPVLRMIAAGLEEIRIRANSWKTSLAKGDVIPGRSTVGGGSLPGETLPTYLLALDVNKPNRFLDLLRKLDVPVVARLEQDRVVFDPRTVLPEDEDLMLGGIQEVL